MTTSATIWFLILTYRRPESLFRLLESVLAQSIAGQVKFRMLIWDNDGDGPRAFKDSTTASDPRIKYLPSPTNLKMVGKRALEDYLFDLCAPDPTDWVVHLDDDVVLSDRWLESALDSAKAEGWSACGSTESWKGELVYSGQTRLRRHSSLPNGPQDLWSWHFEQVPDGSGPVVVEFAGHRALLVRAAIANAVRHDGDMRIGGEDLDYSLSLRAAGATIGIEPRAFIHHRSNGEKDAEGFRIPPDVITSWRTFYLKWGFVRVNAAAEAGVEQSTWLDLITSKDSCDQ